LGEDVDERVFDQDYYADSDDKDEVRFSRQHLRDIVQVQLWLMFRKEYWSRLLDYPGAGGQPYDIDCPPGRVCVSPIDSPSYRRYSCHLFRV
jgi:hypothetical protein